MRLGLVMMQKNETDLLEQWMVYHGELFGYDSLFIHDNGSTCPHVLKLLETARQRGASVKMCGEGRNVFEGKSDILGNTVRALERDDPRAFYFPLDCDEFIVLKPRFRRTPIFDRDAILDYLQTLRRVRRPMVIAGGYWNVPDLKDHFYREYWRKVFFSQGCFGSMNMGFHRGKTRDGVTRRYKTRLAYLHFHNRPFDQLLASARAKLEGRVASMEPDVLRKYTGPGNHLVKYFLMNEQEYLRGFSRRRLIRAGGFGAILAAKNVAWPYGEPGPTAGPAPAAGPV